MSSSTLMALTRKAAAQTRHCPNNTWGSERERADFKGSGAFQIKDCVCGRGGGVGSMDSGTDQSP